MDETGEITGSSAQNIISGKENAATDVAKDLIGNSALHRIGADAMPDAEAFGHVAV